MRVDIVGGANTLYYLLKDHLGSASVTLNTSGTIVTNGEQRYYPFGESRLTTADLKTAHLFTGQLEVGLGGIYSYGARMYSPRLGRFLSADTVVPDYANPQSLNRFSYVYNNPLKYVDPTGHYTECSGTGAFISESTGDGGISWASCWARQRDTGILTSAGVSAESARTVAAARDIMGAETSSFFATAYNDPSFIGGWEVTFTAEFWDGVIKPNLETYLDSWAVQSIFEQSMIDIAVTVVAHMVGFKLKGDIISGISAQVLQSLLGGGTAADIEKMRELIESIDHQVDFVRNTVSESVTGPQESWPLITQHSSRQAHLAHFEPEIRLFRANHNCVQQFRS